MINREEAGMISPELPTGARALNDASRLIRERFEEGPSADQLAYHNREHTEGVVRRATKIADAMGLSPRERTLIEIAAAFHDTVQMWEPSPQDSGAVMRQRKTGGNEQASAEEALKWMKLQKSAAFTDNELELVHSAILVTVPSWSVEHKTVVQAALTPESHPVVRAIALADIGSSGMEPDGFGGEGDALFIEQEMDVIWAIRNAKSPDDISTENQKQYLMRYHTWLDSQLGFARGRQALLEDELGNLSDTAKENVRQLFSHFEDAIKIAETNAKEAKEYSFEQMALRFVPSAFSVKTE